jgi:acyl carrier protein
MRRDVMEVIRETFPFGSQQVSESTPLAELIHDSIDAVELVAVLSSAFGIRVNTDELGGIKTVADVVDYVERQSGEPQGRPTLESF